MPLYFKVYYGTETMANCVKSIQKLSKYSQQDIFNSVSNIIQRVSNKNPIYPSTEEHTKSFLESAKMVCTQLNLDKFLKSEKTVDVYLFKSSCETFFYSESDSYTRTLFIFADEYVENVAMRAITNLIIKDFKCFVMPDFMQEVLCLMNTSLSGNEYFKILKSGSSIERFMAITNIMLMNSRLDNFSISQMEELKDITVHLPAPLDVDMDIATVCDMFLSIYLNEYDNLLNIKEMKLQMFLLTYLDKISKPLGLPCESGCISTIPNDKSIDEDSPDF